MAAADPPTDPPSLLETSRRVLPSFSDPTTRYRQFGPTADMMIKTGAVAGITGLAMGYSRGARMAGLRFRAEHAHRMPRDTKELYFYHRRKNYYVAKHGIQRGLGLGARLAFWTSLFFLAEASVDFLRGGRKDFVSTTTAGIGVAGMFSAANRFTFIEAAKTAKMGLLAGLTYGLMQDGLAMARGQRFRYADFVLRRRADDED